MRLVRSCHCLLTVVAAACGPAENSPPAKPPPELIFDYGMIPHGRSATHDFVLDTRALGAELVPLGVSVDCGCAHATMLLRDGSGNERLATGQPFPEFAARPGEVLVLRLRVDTATKEAADLPLADSRGRLVLQSALDPRPEHRIDVPLRFRFGIDAPVRLSPFAILDFGEVPASSAPMLLTTLRGDPPERPVAFGPVASSDPRLHVTLEPDSDATVLRARFTPGRDAAPAAFHALVTVGTDLPEGYEVRIAVVGRVVADLVARPMNKLSLGMFDFDRDRPEQFVLATDHDRARGPEFAVARLVDGAGRDAADHFAVRLEAVPGDPRSTRVWVRYLGGLKPPEFRGELVLAKDPERGPFLPIQVVAFHRPPP